MFKIEFTVSGVDPSIKDTIESAIAEKLSGVESALQAPVDAINQLVGANLHNVHKHVDIPAIIHSALENWSPTNAPAAAPVADNTQQTDPELEQSKSTVVEKEAEPDQTNNSEKSTLKPISKADRDDIIKKIKDGVSRDELLLQYPGRNVLISRNITKHAPRTIDSNNLDKSTKSEIEERIEAGESVDEIARATGVDWAIINRIVQVRAAS